MTNDFESLDFSNEARELRRFRPRKAALVSGKTDPMAAEAAPPERSNLQLYLQEIGKTALLTIGEEVVLARRIRRGDKAARIT